MIALVLLIVFMVLWLVSLLPAPANVISPYGGIFAWISVFLLGVITHVIHL